MFARDDSMHRVGVEGPQYKIVEVKDNYSPFIFRCVYCRKRAFSGTYFESTHNILHRTSFKRGAQFIARI